jgi:hypothetical protein
LLLLLLKLEALDELYNFIKLGGGFRCETLCAELIHTLMERIV